MPILLHFHHRFAVKSVERIWAMCGLSLIGQLWGRWMMAWLIGHDELLQLSHYICPECLCEKWDCKLHRDRNWCEWINQFCNSVYWISLCPLCGHPWSLPEIVFFHSFRCFLRSLSINNSLFIAILLANHVYITTCCSFIPPLTLLLPMPTSPFFFLFLPLVLPSQHIPRLSINSPPPPHFSFMSGRREWIAFSMFTREVMTSFWGSRDAQLLY